MPMYEGGFNSRAYPERDNRYDRYFDECADGRRDKAPERDFKGCDFCKLLKKKFIGQFIFLGVKCDSVVRLFFGFVTCYSFDEKDNTIKLFKSPVGGKVLVTACCSDIKGFGYFSGVAVTEENMEEVMGQVKANFRKPSA